MAHSLWIMSTKGFMIIYTVTWADARVSVDGSFPNLPIMTSIGVIIKKDKERVLICSLFGENDEPRVITAIPASLIRKIKKV